MTRDLLEMADWLEAAGVADVAMESTGVFWKPIFNILESRFVVLLVNARPGDFFDRLEPKRLTHYYLKRLERLGYKVTLQTTVAS